MDIDNIDVIINELLDDNEIHVNVILPNLDNLLLINEIQDDIPVRNEGYYENIIPNYSLDDFRDHFRMQRGTFQILLNSLRNNQPLGLETVIPFEKKLLFSLWVLAKPETFLACGDRFGMAKSTSHKIFFSIVEQISNLKNEYIIWPAQNIRRQIAENIENKSGIPSVAGAIDGCHIPIKAPVHNAVDYYNRNNYHSIILQGVCDDRKYFTDIFVGCPGRMHDARVFRISPLYNQLSHNRNILLSADQHLLGDSAYPLNNFLLKPYRDNGHLNERQIRFNTRMSVARSVIEQAFGLLKGKFRRLKYLDMSHMDMIPMVITAACVLHNFIIDQEGPQDDIEMEPNDDNHNINNDNAQIQDNHDGLLKRDNIANML